MNIIWNEVENWNIQAFLTNNDDGHFRMWNAVPILVENDVQITMNKFHTCTFVQFSMKLATTC